jgi:hypothetical protein
MVPVDQVLQEAAQVFAPATGSAAAGDLLVLLSAAATAAAAAAAGGVQPELQQDVRLGCLHLL